MFNTLDHFNEIINQKSKKLLSGYLKASVSKLDPESEQSHKSKQLIKEINNGLKAETSIREYNKL